ncbi:MAG: hypothetical protein WD876_03235 [Candidatus Pacearchaeota archaeon]
MGCADGGSIADLARTGIFLTLDPKEKRIGKTIDEIIAERNVTDEKMKRVYKLAANKLAEERFLHYSEEKKVYVFSRDDDGKYSWQHATINDRIANYFLNFFH